MFSLFDSCLNTELDFSLLIYYLLIKEPVLPNFDEITGLFVSTVPIVSKFIW